MVAHEALRASTSFGDALKMMTAPAPRGLFAALSSPAINSRRRILDTSRCSEEPMQLPLRAPFAAASYQPQELFGVQAVAQNLFEGQRLKSGLSRGKSDGGRYPRCRPAQYRYEITRSHR